MTSALIAQWLPWLLSAITIASTVLTGNKHPKAWLLSLAGQAGWLVYIVAASAWGFLPLTATLTVLYWRNHLKWNAQPEPDFEDTDFGALEETKTEPGDALHFFRQTKPLPEPSEKTLTFRRYASDLVRNPKPMLVAPLIPGLKAGETLADYIGEVQAEEFNPPTCGVLAGEPEVVGVQCKDGGKCHHRCDTACFRQACCSPLTASGLDRNWEPTVPGVEVKELSPIEALAAKIEAEDAHHDDPSEATMNRMVEAELTFLEATHPRLLINPELIGEMDLGDAMKPGAVVVVPYSEPTITRIYGTAEEEVMEELMALNAVNTSDASIYMEAQRLINRAVVERKVLTISLEPIEPLAMGNHRMVPEVRDARVVA